jgi:hypothetical protein
VRGPLGGISSSDEQSNAPIGSMLISGVDEGVAVSKVTELFGERESTSKSCSSSLKEHEW